MHPLTRTGLAALLAAAATTPALAQGYGGQGYGSQGYGASTGGGQGGAQGYDPQAYPPSTYDRGASSGYQPSSGRPSYNDPNARPGDYDRAGGYAQPEQYDQRQGQGGGQEDPQELARRLGLTPSQRGAFDAYQRAFQPDEARQRQEEDEMRRAPSLTTPQRLDAARAALGRDRADFDRTDAATRAFYAQLSPGQRRTFDQLTAPQMDDGGGQDGGGGPSPTQPSARPPR